MKAFPAISILALIASTSLAMATPPPAAAPEMAEAMTAAALSAMTADEMSATEAANKALVLEFWRNVFDRKDVSRAREYLAEDYIQHNPTVAGGLSGFEEFFTEYWADGPLPDEEVVDTEFAIVMAEGDLVQLVQKITLPDPDDEEKTYDSYWFDLFRVKDGKLVEHWDPAMRGE